jgi:thioesterase domain-containing protein
VCEAFRDALKLPQVGPDDDFFELGGHSIKAILLSSALRRALGRDVPILAVFDHPTPRRLARLLAVPAAAPSAEASLTLLRDAGAGAANVVFLPTVVGTPALFRGLAAALAPGLRCWGLQCPGFDAPATPAASIESLGERLAELLLRSLPPTPGTGLTLVGWSFGAYLAFETARHLQARVGELRLVLIDVPPRTAAAVHDARDAPAPALEAEIRQQLGLQLAAPDLARLQALAQHHYRLLDAYRLSQPLHGLLVAVEAGDGPLRAGMQGYAAWTRGRFEHHVIGGDHYSMLAAPHRDALVRLLDATALPQPRALAPTSNMEN